MAEPTETASQADTAADAPSESPAEVEPKSEETPPDEASNDDKKEDSDAKDTEASAVPSTSKEETPAATEGGGGTTDFLAETPYFHVFCDEEMKSLHEHANVLREISKEAKAMTSMGLMMSAAAQRLAKCCRLQAPLSRSFSTDEAREAAELERHEQRKEIVGEEMTDLLETLGSVLDEMAGTQREMCQTIEATLGTAFESFADTEVDVMDTLYAEVDQASASAEKLTTQYLNGKQVRIPGVGETAEKQANSYIGSFLKRAEALTKSSKGENSPATDGTENQGPESAAAIAANLRTSLEQIRLEQAKAQLKRFQLMSHLITFKSRRKFQLGESTMATIRDIRSAYGHTTAALDEIVPKAEVISENQSGLHKKYNEHELTEFTDPETKLQKYVEEAEAKQIEAKRNAFFIEEGDTSHIDSQTLDIDEIEKVTDIWNIPNQLASRSYFQRGKPSGIVMEGWLYRKSAMMISLQPWQRLWFVMDGESLYYADDSRKPKDGLPAYVKVLDLVDASLKELPDNEANHRFLFQIASPKVRPIILQARGPDEYKLWTEGIKNRDGQEKKWSGFSSDDCLFDENLTN